VTLGPVAGANDFEIRVSTLKQTVSIVAQ